MARCPDSTPSVSTVHSAMPRQPSASRRAWWPLGALVLALCLLASTPAVASESLFAEPASSPFCAAQEAKGEGLCDLFLGWKWNGQTCEGISGCSCVGADCSDLFTTLDACQSRYCRCLCEPQDAAGLGECELLLGWRWNGSTCEALSGCSCIGEDCDELFSTFVDCDQAHRACPCAAQDVQAIGACELILGYQWDGRSCSPLVGCSCQGSDCANLYSSPAECIKARLKCVCRAQEAEGEGLCDLFLGWKWNGESCEGISGCSCVGPDCPNLYTDLASCQAVHEDCPCRAQDAVGVGLCDLFLGWKWNGASCESVSGCSCQGSDCNNLFNTLGACKNANRSCLCRPQEARAEGPCDQFFGYRWNGFECESLSGCSCIGSDCDELYTTASACAKAHNACPCGIQDATGVGPCDQFFGYRWNGVECESISGCSCQGADCNNLSQTLSGCQSAHRDCDPCCGCTSCLPANSISPAAE